MIIFIGWEPANKTIRKMYLIVASRKISYSNVTMYS